MSSPVPSTRVQLCGAFAVEIDGQRVDRRLPGKQGRLLFAYLTLFRLQPVSRDRLVDVLWGSSAPAGAGGALSVLVSKMRAAVGHGVLTGRTELSLALPEPARVDVEDAVAALHSAESAIALQDWRRAWTPALTAQLVARRRFLPETDAPWTETWRGKLADVHVRALECYATACLRLGGTELPGAERAARELVDAAPLRETGHLLLMEVLAARGNVAEAIAVYQRLRTELREQLGVDPCQAVQDGYLQLLG
ncbi:DNA-binding SARP family transcriptional activator [Pseudonocardia hierapolitana]|uniref:DNA-binding SARP family transcriptional activator n=1 Tax=Pseudonocardia hierapolitana TaxID=1128676 RepID=A0A561SWG7_9PSEU|nr:BTAD domain-containing putative transcriptional regulator [Pseudonocardia hierapolitana]TWF79209.1 DNA-binding SARP family transcriptional activator [Pseudonocardia hierapolitana]